MPRVFTQTFTVPPDAIDELVADLSGAQLFARKVRVDYASHCAQVDEIRERLRADMEGLAPRPSAIPLYSTVIGGRIDGATLDAEYWWRNLRQPVRFAAAVQALAGDGHRAFVEVSPHPVLIPALRDNLATDGTSTTPTAPTATMTNPGSPITGSKSFDGTSTDAGGSGVASLTFQVSPIGLNTWSDMCSDTTSPYACSYDTTALSDGQYDFRSLATDNAGNTATSTVYSGAIVDNNAPTASVTDPVADFHPKPVTAPPPDCPTSVHPPPAAVISQYAMYVAPAGPTEYTPFVAPSVAPLSWRSLQLA